MNQYDPGDPLTVLRADDLPVPPDPAFATRLRTRLEEAASLPAEPGEEMGRTGRRNPFRKRRAVPKASGPRTVRLRTVAAAAAAVIALLVGAGWISSLGQKDFKASPNQYTTPATSDDLSGGVETRPDSGIVAGRDEPGALPAEVPQNAPANPVPGAPPPPQDATTVAPDIVTTGSMTMVVAEPMEVADRLVSAVTGAGGRVESRQDQSGSSSPTVSITLRIPSTKVDAVVADAKKFGDVESMSIEHTDVTSQRVDLDARIEALQTSVDRLRELMSRAGDLSDLLAAESALTERQAELDSLKAQRTELGDQIDYSSISVYISVEQQTETRVGFLGAVQRGWQSLMSTLHGLAVTVGFLLPWIPVLAVLAVVIYFLVRRFRKARQH